MQTSPQQKMSQSGEGFKERTLIISNLSADFHKDHDIIGNQDPYFVLELSKDTVTTKVMKSAGTHAEWPAEEGYRLHDRGEHPELIARAFNKNSLLKDSSLGEGRIPMVQLGTGQEHTVPLYDKKGQTTGELRFRAQEEQGGQLGSQTGQQAMGTGATAGAAGAAAAGAGAAGAMSRNDRDRDDTVLREKEFAGKHHDKHYDKHRTDPRTYDNTREGQGMVDTGRDGNTGMIHQGTTGTTNMQGATNPQGVSNMQSSNEQTGMLRDGAVAGAVGAGAGAGAGYMASRNQGQTGEIGNNQMTNQGGNRDLPGSTTYGSNQGGMGGGMVGGAPRQHETTGQRVEEHMPGHHNQQGGMGGGMVGGGPRQHETMGQRMEEHMPGHHNQQGQMGTMGNNQMGNNQMTNQGGNSDLTTSQVTGGPSGQGVLTNKSSNVTNRDVDTTQENTTSNRGGLEVEQNRNVTDTVDESTKESSEHFKKGRGYAVELESGDDHWERSLAAAKKAREQAMIVERESQATHAKLLAAQEATRNFEKARREHMAIQERLAALDLENKRANFERMSKEYEAHMARVSGKEGQVDAAQQAANELRAEVNQKGMALNEEVNATKLHQSRLGELEAELARLEGLHGAADAAHKDHLSRLEPLRTRHRSLQETFAGVEAEMAESRARRENFEAKERELQGLLDTHSREFDATRTDFEEMEEMGRKKAADAEARANELRTLEAEAAEVQAHLAEHRNRIGVLKQETEAKLASAGELADTAARKEAELDAAQQSIDEKERLAGSAATALSEVQAQKGPLEEKVRNERSTFDHHKEVIDEMHRKLGMAREQVDLAQARKEELWEKAKWHGEQADKASDSHFLHAHHDHNLVVGGGSSVPATDMLKQGTTTRTVLETAGEKIGI